MHNFLESPMGIHLNSGKSWGVLRESIRISLWKIKILLCNYLLIAVGPLCCHHYHFHWCHWHSPYWCDCRYCYNHIFDFVINTIPKNVDTPNSQILQCLYPAFRNAPLRTEISVPNGVLWDMARGHCGICEVLVNKSNSLFEPIHILQ